LKNIYIVVCNSIVINSLIIINTYMIPLTLALSLQGRGDYSWFLPELLRIKHNE